MPIFNHNLPPRVVQGNGDTDAAYQEGYTAGQTAGYTEGHEAGHEEGYAEGHEEGLTDGRNAQHTEFWDAFFERYNERSYWTTNAFSCFSDAMFYPTQNIKILASGAVFQRCGALNIKQRLIDCGVELDTSECTYLLQCFQECQSTHYPAINASKSRNCSYTFNAPVVWIDKYIVSENTPFSNTFAWANHLEHIIFEGVIGTNGLKLYESPLLDRESVLSVITCLQDKTGDTSGTAWKIEIGDVNIAKLTEEELQTAYDKGWTVV